MEISRNSGAASGNTGGKRAGPQNPHDQEHIRSGASEPVFSGNVARESCYR
jgi:hypothetical protein